MTMEVLMNALWNLMLLLAAVVPAVLVALLVHWIVFRACRRFSTKSPTLPDGVINKHCRRAGRWMLVTAAVFFVLRQVQEVGPVMRGIQHALSLLLIFTIAWLLNQLVWVFQDIQSGYQRQSPCPQSTYPTYIDSTDTDGDYRDVGRCGNADDL
jgi:uncharacterized membrane protein (UPF0182 family)